MSGNMSGVRTTFSLVSMGITLVSQTKAPTRGSHMGGRTPWAKNLQVRCCADCKCQLKSYSSYGCNERNRQL